MKKVNRDGLTEEEFLAQYKPKNYERPSVTVDMLVLGMSASLDGLKILLIQRNNHPYIDSWALAGGFVGMKESAYEAACRELEEETGLTDVYLEQIYTMSQPGRDPRMRVIDIAYMALIPETPVRAGDDAKDAMWFDIVFTDEVLRLEHKEKGIVIEYKLQKKTFRNGRVKIDSLIPILNSEDSLAFDHAQIVLEGLMRLRNKIEYSDIAFNLVPEEFTLPDLQRVYEIILGRSLYKTNFKSSLANKIIPLNRKGASIVGNKASALYQYDTK